jgi:hypothetical protein
MTDNDDPAPSRGAASHASGKDESAEAGAERDKENAGRVRIDLVSVRIAPTDPEVPSAKRRGALRHQRSLVGLTAVVMGLLSITLALLYRASQQVRTRDATTGAQPRVDDQRDQAVSPHRHGDPSRATSSPPPSPGVGSGYQAPTDDTSSDSAPAGTGSSPSKGRPPALDIIRTPAF